VVLGGSLSAAQRKGYEMNKDELKKVLEKHKKWLSCDDSGERANLREADLREADLSRADLSRADLREADLRGADLSRANLREADLREADLSGADLREADLREADLSWANLREADLREADLSWADLSRADLCGAKNIPDYVVGVALIATQDIKTGWKKLQGGLICKIQIPAKAKRSNSTGRKCRCEYAKVVEIWDGDKPMKEGVSQWDNNFEYKVGKTVYCDEWEDNRWQECGGGIHFFLTRVEAEDW